MTEEVEVPGVRVEALVGDRASPDMIEEGVVANVVTYSAVIDSCAKAQTLLTESAGESYSLH